MKIETLEKIRVPAGVRLLLDDEQLDARRHMVELDEDDVALVVKPMEFKAGETLGVVGDLPIVIHSSQYRMIEGQTAPALAYADSVADGAANPIEKSGKRSAAVRRK